MVLSHHRPTPHFRSRTGGILLAAAALAGCGGGGERTVTVINQVPSPTATAEGKTIGVASGRGTPVFCTVRLPKCWQSARLVAPPALGDLCRRRPAAYWQLEPIVIQHTYEDGIEPEVIGEIRYCEDDTGYSP